MLFDQFIEVTKGWWEAYFQRIGAAQRQGQLNSNGGRVLYPNILLVMNCSGHYVAELVGAVEKFSGFSVKRHKERSIYRYLSQFDDSKPDSVFHLNGACQVLRSLCLAQEADLQEVKERFPQIELYPSRLVRVGGRGSPLSFGDDFLSCSLDNCILVNRRENAFRCKSILSSSIVSSSINKKQLMDLFGSIANDNVVMGVHTSTDDDLRLVLGGQLQSMFLFPNLRETTIGEFINLHPEIIKKVFGAKSFIYEPYLEWLEHDGTCEDTAINPDLLVERQDGCYDIFDLKTALLEKRSITKGPRSRRQFIDEIENGISQLANYREYFSYNQNAELALQKYGIRIDDPQLTLVIGSWENVDVGKVNQACRKHRGIRVIDYDTVCHMFIGSH